MDLRRGGPGAGPGIRASDAERDRVVGLLKEHHVDGRLSLDEFSERTSTAYAARTRDELIMVLRDLPVIAQTTPAPAPPSYPAPAAARSPVAATRAAVVAALMVVVTLLVAGVLVLGFASAEAGPDESVRVPQPGPVAPVPEPGPVAPVPEQPEVPLEQPG